MVDNDLRKLIALGRVDRQLEFALFDLKFRRNGFALARTGGQALFERHFRPGHRLRELGAVFVLIRPGPHRRANEQPNQHQPRDHRLFSHSILLLSKISEINSVSGTYGARELLLQHGRPFRSRTVSQDQGNRVLRSQSFQHIIFMNHTQFTTTTPTASLFGEAPTLVVATTLRCATSIMMTSFEPVLLTTTRRPSGVNPIQFGSRPTKTRPTTSWSSVPTMVTSSVIWVVIQSCLPSGVTASPCASFPSTANLDSPKEMRFTTPFSARSTTRQPFNRRMVW